MTCPYCGKPPPFHFSFCEKGFICFVCGEKGTLGKLFKYVGVNGSVPTTFKRPPPIQPFPKYIPNWVNMPKITYMTQYVMNHDNRQLWNTHYKPIAPELVDAYHLGYGILPNSKCKHHRLLLPIFKENKLVCLRGRRIACECQKWMTSGGWTLSNIPLFNSWQIKSNDVVAICENPVDAIIGSQSDLIPLVQNHIHRTDQNISVVATLSVVYWKAHWERMLKKARKVLIVYDNDQPGINASQKLHQTLRKARIRVEIFQWPDDTPPKYDLGDYLAQLDVDSP